MRTAACATLSFGQVPIPVKLCLAAASDRSPIHLITPKGNRVCVKYVDCKTGEQVSWDQIRRGVEVAPDTYRALTKPEWDEVAGKKRKLIEVREVVPPPAIPVYQLKKSYYLIPNKSDKAYRLLQRMLHRMRHHIVGKWYTRTGHDHCVVIQPVGLSLLMSLVWYPNQCRELDLHFPHGTEASPHEARLAQSLLDMLVRPEVQWDAYQDEWQARLGALLTHKQGRVVNIERLLRKSLKRKR